MYFTYLWLIKYIKKNLSIFTEIIKTLQQRMSGGDP